MSDQSKDQNTTIDNIKSKLNINAKDKKADIYGRFFRKVLIVFIITVVIAVITILIIFKKASSGEELTKVPSLVGMDVIEAAMELQELGLIAEIDTKYDDEIEKYVVTRQYPEQGVTVREGRAVTLLVSLGVDMYVVPDLVGMYVQDAEAILSEENIPYDITEMQSSSYETNTVISQTLEAGLEVDRSVKLDLTVNSDLKYNEYRVGDYSNKQVDYVVETLYDDGVIPALAKQLTSSESMDGVVLGQSPAVGEIVKKNTAITLYVGVYGEDALEQENYDYHIFRWYLPSMSAFTNGMRPDEIEEIQEAHVVVTIEDELGDELEIYNSYDSYGKMITEVFRSFGYTELYVFVNNKYFKEVSYGN